MFRNTLCRSARYLQVKRAPFGAGTARRWYSSPTQFGGKQDSGFNMMNFVMVALIGTGIFGVVVHKVDEQDPTKSMLKRKNSFTDQEWELYMNSIKRKVLLFKPTTEVFMVPEPSKLDASKLGPDVKVVDLNEVIKDEIENHKDRYGTLLESHLVSSNDQGYKFDTRLAHGIFSKLMRLRLETLRNEDEAERSKYVLLNFPNNMQEAIKFESDVAVVKKLIVFDDVKSDTTEYYETVGKVSRVGSVDEVLKSL